MGLKVMANGYSKEITVGTIASLVGMVIGAIVFHFTVSDRYRTEGTKGASLESRVTGVESRVGKLEGIHDAHDQELLRFFGELPGLRKEIDRLNRNLTDTQQEVGKLRDELSAMKGRNSAMDKMGGKGMVRIGDPQ